MRFFLYIFSLSLSLSFSLLFSFSARFTSLFPPIHSFTRCCPLLSHYYLFLTMCSTPQFSLCLLSYLTVLLRISTSDDSFSFSSSPCFPSEYSLSLPIMFLFLPPPHLSILSRLVWLSLECNEKIDHSDWLPSALSDSSKLF